MNQRMEYYKRCYCITRKMKKILSEVLTEIFDAKPRYQWEYPWENAFLFDPSLCNYTKDRRILSEILTLL